MGHQSILELLEGRMRKLRLLASHLVRGQQALARWDLEAVDESNSAQEQLCCELQQIDRQIKLLPRPDATRDVRLREVLQEHESLRREVLRINNIQAEFLKRSQRSLSVLSNIVLGALGTYKPSKPQILAASAPEGGR